MAEKTISNQSIQKMFQIIEAMAQECCPVRLNDISEKCGLSPSTTLRILNTLIQNGYASQNAETSLYSLSYRFVWIGNCIRENLSLNQLMRPYLQNVSKKIGVSSALSIPQDDHVVYIDEVIPARQMLRIYHHLGALNPMYATAAGKVFLSRYSKGELNRYLLHHELSGFTPHTISTREELESQLDQIRSNGYAVNDEESLLGMRCISVPVYGSGDRVIASISISGTIYQLAKEKLPMLTSLMLSMSEQLHKECQPVLSAFISDMI